MNMNIGKSTKIAMASSDTTNKMLMKEFGATNATVCAWRRKNTQNGDTIQKLADYFGMSASDFVKLGE